MPSTEDKWSNDFVRKYAQIFSKLDFSTSSSPWLGTGVPLCMPSYTFRQVKAWKQKVKSWIRLCERCHVAALQSTMLDVPAIPTSVSFPCQPTLIYSRGDTRLECGSLWACHAHTEHTLGPDIQCHYLHGHECSIPWNFPGYVSVQK